MAKLNTGDVPEDISVEDIMASLSKETRADVVFGSEIVKRVLPTASFGLNQKIGGGLRLGMQHTFWGGEGAGKSGFLMETVGINQKNGVPCAWIDAEGVFDPEWASKLGVDPEKLIVSRAATIPEATDKQIEWIRKGVRLIVLDTTSALMSKSFVDKNGEIKGFDDTAQLGQMAKDLGQMSKMVMGINYTCAVVHISQQRVNVGSPAMHKPYMQTGGKEIGHNDALRVRLIGTGTDDKLLKTKVQRGNNLVEEVVGFPVDYIMNKNRITGDITPGTYDFMRANNTYKPGVNYVGEVLDWAVNFGFAEKGGAWYTIGEHRAQGRAAAVKLLLENPELAKSLEDQIVQSI